MCVAGVPFDVFTKQQAEYYLLYMQRSVSGVLPGKQQELLLVEQPQCSLMRAAVQVPQRSGQQVWQSISH